LDELIQCYLPGIAGFAITVLNDSLLQSSFTHHDLMGYAQQIGVSKHYAWSIVSVVQQNIDFG